MLEKLKRHELSAMFGDMGKSEVSVIASSIRGDGLIHPITLWQGQVLDGWHRYQACLKAGVEPRFIEFDGDERAALAFVMAENEHRRHLCDAMRVSVSKKVLNWHKDRATGGGYRVVTENESDSIPGIESSKEVTAEAVAQVAKVSVATVHRHTAIEKKAPRLLGMVEKGEVGLKTAERACRSVSGEVLAGATPSQVKAFAQALDSRFESRVNRLERLAREFRQEWDVLVVMSPEDPIQQGMLQGALSVASREIRLCRAVIV